MHPRCVRHVGCKHVNRSALPFKLLQHCNGIARSGATTTTSKHQPSCTALHHPCGKRQSESANATSDEVRCLAFEADPTVTTRRWCRQRRSAAQTGHGLVAKARRRASQQPWHEAARLQPRPRWPVRRSHRRSCPRGAHAARRRKLARAAAVSRADLAVDTTRCEAESACPRRSKTRAGACPPEALVPLLTTATGTVALSPPLRAWETDGPISR